MRVLADLRHLCDRLGFNNARLDRRSHDFYLNEKAYRPLAMGSKR
jgi:hypothetical protein